MNLMSGNDPAQVAIETAAGDHGGRLTSIVSAVALLFSGYSMFETTLKQPALMVYVTDTISYTRDPYGSYEVLAVPVTISNSGARDGAVVSMQLEVKNQAGQSEKFLASYTADAQYFGTSDNVTTRQKRPKLPFAPLSIAGRGAYSGTILFYPPDYREQKLVEPKSKIEMTLKLLTPAPDGWMERVLGNSPPVIQLSADVPNFLPGALLVGDMARLRVTTGVASIPR